MKELHPWQIHPSDLIQYAIKHVYSKSEFNQRIGYLLLDFGVETILKTFLLLPQDILKSKVSYSKRRQALGSNFHELLEMVKNVAGNKLKEIDLNHILYFHSQRNILYHEASSISIDKGLLNRYAELGVELLKLLLSVDLTQYLIQSSTALEDKTDKNEYIKDIKIYQNRLEKLLNQFYDYINSYVNYLEPSFLSPELKKEIPIKHYTIVNFSNLPPEEVIKSKAEIKSLEEAHLEREKYLEQIMKKIPKVIAEYLTNHKEHKYQILEAVTGEYNHFLATFVRLHYDYIEIIDTKEHRYDLILSESESYIASFHPWYIEDYNRLHQKELNKIKLSGNTLISKFLKINHYLDKHVPN